MPGQHTQVERGKAFEYSVLTAVYTFLSPNQPVSIVTNSAYHITKDCFDGLDEDYQDKMIVAAEAAIKHIVSLEPQLLYPFDNTPLVLAIQEDSQGIAGDVRDVLTIRKQNSWEIGISCKHNHSAMKHSRLSKRLDFGSLWLGHPCSTSYFDTIEPIFSRLEQLKAQRVLWRDLDDKVETVYVPVLEAFINELKRIADEHEDAPTKLIEYLLGRNDFYKVVSKDSQHKTSIQAYNLNGTLNRNAKSEKSNTRIGKLPLPKRIFDINFVPNSQNTVEVVCDFGWSVSLRIHNASTKIEPSLKFDVQLKGMPPELYTHHEPWSKPRGTYHYESINHLPCQGLS